MRSKSLCILLILASVLAIPFRAFAQQTLGAIDGTISDSTGAALGSAQVNLQGESTGLTRTSTSSGSGGYEFVNLPIGLYTITVTQQGFQQQVLNHIPVQENRTATVNVRLKPGSVNESVQVTATPLLNATDTTNGYVLDRAQIESTPLATGSFTQLATLAPGVSGQFIAGTGTNAGFGNQPIWVNGQRDTSNTFQVDGVDITNLFNGKTTSQSVSQRLNFNIGEGNTNSGGETATSTSVYGSSGQSLASPPPEFIQELRVNTSMYDAQQGTTSGAHVDVSTLSGTNDLHGQVWGLRATNWLNADPFFYNQAVALGLLNKSEANPELHRFVGGGTLGGPVIKDKLFYFLGYQAQRVSDQLTGLSQLLIPPGLGSDRSASTLLNICNNDGFYSCPSTVDPAALAIMQAKLPNGNFLVPSAGNSSTNFGYNTDLVSTSRFQADQATGSLDYNLSKKDQLSLKYYYQRAPSTSPFGVSTTEGFTQLEDTGAQVGAIDNTIAFGPHLSWEQRLGFSRQKVYSNFQQQVSPSSVGITIPGTTKFPGIGVSNFGDPNNFGSLTLGPNSDFVDDGYFQNRWAPTTNAILAIGKHTIAAGVNYAYTQLNIENNRVGSAVVNLRGFDNFLDGKVHDGSILLGNTRRYYRSNEIGSYVQDKWQVTPNLSLTAGLRYDYDGPLSEKNGNLFNFDASRFQATDTAVVNDGLIVAGNNKQFATPGVSDSTLSGRQWGFGPRVGFAFAPDAFHGTVVVRGGFGLYYDRGEYFQYLSPPAGQGVSGPFGVTQEPPLANYVNASGNLDTPFGTAPLPQPNPNPNTFASLLPTAAALRQACTAANVYNAGAATSYNCAVRTYPIGNYNIHNVLPYSENFMLDMQWQPTTTLAVTLGYQGNVGRHLIVPLPFNQPQIASPSHPVNGETYSYGYQVLSQSRRDSSGNPQPMSTEPYDTFDGGNVDLRVPYVGYDPNSTSFTSAGVSNYNSLQAQVQKRMSRGVQFGFSYTYSHTLDEQSDLGLFFTGDNPQRLGDSYASADFDLTHVISFNYTFALPNMVKSKNLLSRITNGWSLIGITVLESGQPYSIYDYTGAVASTYYGTYASLLNPIVPLAPGVSPKKALTGHSGAFLDSSGNPIPAINPADITIPLLNPGQGGVPPCDASGGPGGGPLCDNYETTFAHGQRNIFRQAFQKRADISLHKEAALTDRFNLIYDFNVFNSTNTPNFDIPTNNTSIGAFCYSNPNVTGFCNGSQVIPLNGNPLKELYTLPTTSNLNGFSVVQHTIGSARIVQMTLHLNF